MLCACGSDLEDGSRIDKLRLLALRADQPFARPAERVSLQLLAADTERRELHYALGTCTNPKGSTASGCLEALDGPLQPLELDAAAFEVEVPADVLDELPESARPSALFGAVVVACPGSIARGETSGVPVVCRDEAGEKLPIEAFEVGVKRIFVRERDRNQNPEITRLTWDGEDWPEDQVPEVRACAGAAGGDIEDCEAELRHRIGVQVSAAEHGTDENGTRFAEQQVVQFYASQGVFERPVRIAGDADNSWAAQEKTAGEPARLWVVVRDDRGGVGWVSRQVRVR
ncbi:MAG TPA: hypothetical protein VJR89_32095 [Polyangiales bacterium]|nr:hypothetical protein [Polyangiales bacterium]